jgi:hypothetical protein
LDARSRDQDEFRFRPALFDADVFAAFHDPPCRIVDVSIHDVPQGFVADQFKGDA